MSNLQRWLADLGLEPYFPRLSENGIDLAVLPDLTDQDLTQLGLLLGHGRKLMAAAARLRDTPGLAPTSGAETQAVQKPQAHPQAERRQVTVLSSDLVGSTALSAPLDPDDSLPIAGGYRRTSRGVPPLRLAPETRCGFTISRLATIPGGSPHP